MNNNNYYVKNYNEREGLSKGQKIIIILLLIILLLGLVAVLYKKGVFSSKIPETRTVMIYLDGSDLESENGFATLDMDSLNPSVIDLTKTTILVYTGGAREWHNFVRNDENAIYILKENGFEKLETYPQKNMGNPDTLSQFLTYGYDNYKSDIYDLILYDHGGAVQGAMQDEIFNDLLSLYEMGKALGNSPFNEKNKLESITFLTCLNGTIEVATALSKYSKYMIASEEVTLGSKVVSILNYLNSVIPSDDVIEVGNKLFAQYDKLVEDADLFGQVATTYSVIDLSKIDELNKEINNFFKNIDLNDNYSKIAKARANLFQYGKQYKYYDMVDLYDLIYNIRDIDNNAYNKFAEALNNAVIINHTNLDSSHGLSIYFPYNGEKFINLYKSVVSLRDYGDFIIMFNDKKNNQQPYSFNMSLNESKLEDGKNVKFKLTQEQIDAFGNAVFTVVKKDKKHEGYYYYLYATNDVTLDSDGYLNAYLKNNFIKVTDDKGIESFIRVTNYTKNNYNELYSSARLTDEDNKNSTDLDAYYKVATVYFKDDNGEPKISHAILNSRNDLIDKTLINLDEIEYIDLPIGSVKMVDENGKYTSDYETAPISYFHETKFKDLKLNWSSLDDDGDYYYAFTVYDYNNNHYDTDLIKLE